MTPDAIDELLAALHDCLDFPTAVYDDMGKRYRELDSRVSMLRGSIAAALESETGFGLSALTQVAWDYADRPLGYEPYQRPEVTA